MRLKKQRKKKKSQIPFPDIFFVGGLGWPWVMMFVGLKTKFVNFNRSSRLFFNPLEAGKIFFFFCILRRMGKKIK